MATPPFLAMLAACVGAAWPVAFADAITTVATNPAGDQVLVYQVRGQTGRSLYASVRERGGSFGPLRAIAPPPGVFKPEAFVDDAGGSVVAWQRLDTLIGGGQGVAVGAAVRAPGRRFGSPAKLYEGESGFVRLAGSPQGHAFVTWSARSASHDLAAHKPPGGTLSEPAPLPTAFFGSPGPNAELAAVAVDVDGTAHLIASEYHPDTRTIGLLESVRPPGGEFGPLDELMQLPEVASPRVVASRGGRVLVLWTDQKNLVAVERPPGGSFGAPFEVAHNGGA